MKTILALVVTLATLSSTSLAYATPRTGSINILGGEPLMNGGTPSQDMTRVSGFYSPETGLFQVTIRFLTPVSTSNPAGIYVYPRTDPSGSCFHNIDDGFLVSDTEPEYQSLLGTTKKVSSDHYELTLEDTQHPNVDYRCISLKIGTFEKTYDELSPPLYFDGYGPAPVVQAPILQPPISPAPTTPTSAPEIKKPVKLTNKQLLSRALNKCKKVKNKKKRAKCNSSARKKYTSKKKTK